MVKFVTFCFDDIRIITNLNNDDSFFPSNKAHILGIELPNYVEGLFEIKNIPNLVINLDSLLELNSSPNSETSIFFKMANNNFDFVLRISFPSIREIEIKENLHSKEVIHTTDFRFLRHLDIEGEIYIYLDRNELSKFLANEISLNLQNNWMKYDFKWITQLETNYTKHIQNTHHQLSFQALNTANNIVNISVIKIGEFFFGFRENEICEITLSNESVTTISGAPIWVDGLIEYRGESIPRVNLCNLLNYKCLDNKSNITIILGSHEKFAINAESIQFLDPSSLSDLHQDYQSNNLPFTQIFTFNENFVLMINTPIINYSILSNPIAQEWDIWRTWFTTFRSSNYVKSTTNYTATEYLNLKYQDIDVLVHVEENYTFFIPNNNVTPLPFVPDFCLGLVELDTKPCIYIDLQSMLDLPPAVTTEHVVLQFSNEFGDFAFLIPKPITLLDDYITGVIIPQIANEYITPISSYYILSDSPCLLLEPGKLTKYLSNLLTIHLEANWIDKCKSLNTLLVQPILSLNFDEYRILPKQVIQSHLNRSEKTKETFYCVTLGPLEIVLNSSNILALDMVGSQLTIMPYELNCLVGLLDYQNSHLPALDLSNWLGLGRFTNDYCVIIRHQNFSFALLIPTMPSYLELTENDEITEVSSKSTSLPIDKIYVTSDKILYHVNYQVLLESVINNKLGEIDNGHWTSFLSLKYKPLEVHRKQSNATLIVSLVGETWIGFVPDDILEIREYNAKYHRSYNNQTYFNHRGRWIPSIDLNLIFDHIISDPPIISVIFESQDFVFEILMNSIDIVEIGEEETYTQKWNFQENSLIWDGAKIYKTETQFILNLEPKSIFLENQDRFDLELEESLPEEIEVDLGNSIGLRDDPGNYLGFCDPNYSVFLVTFNNFENGTCDLQIAFPVNTVEEIKLNLPNHSDFHPWGHAYDGQEFIYMKVKHGNNDDFYQIPSTCKLMAFNKSQIIHENGSISIDFKQEKIPVQKILKKEVNR